MTIISEKEKIRRAFRDRRLALSEQETAERSRQVNQNFITNLLPKFYQKNSAKKFDKIFSLYLSSYGEVSTNLIAEHFEKNEIQFSYPKIIQKNHPLNFILAKKNQKFIANQFFPKLLEPASDEQILPDLLILPLVAFDTELSRLGMGGGFFDRTIESLKKQKSQIITIGLAYYFQRLEQALPTEKTDQKLDFIVTENQIFSAS